MEGYAKSWSAVYNYCANAQPQSTLEIKGVPSLVNVTTLREAWLVNIY